MKSLEDFKNGTYSFERNKFDGNIDVNGKKISEIRSKYWKDFLGNEFGNYEKYLSKEFNIKRNDFEQILSEQGFSIKKSEEIIMWEDFIELLQSCYCDDVQLHNFYVVNEKSERVKPLFYTFYIPFVKVAIFKLKRYIRDYDVTEDIINQFTVQLLDKLTNISYRTLILELNIAKEEGELKGESKEDRYQYFLEYCLIEKFWDYLEEYPVMFRLMVETVNNWILSTSEFIEHFYKDSLELNDVFGISNRIKKVDLSVSDSHNGGKSVIIVHTDNNKLVVYKPRNLELDENFQKTLKLFNEVMGSELYSIKILNKGSYGWTEYVMHEPCKDGFDMETYYKELGELLFILYILRGNDIHYENIIAHGRHPVLIDLETVFHNKTNEFEKMSAADRIYEVIENSVRRVGILPNIIWGKDGDVGVDVSAMTNEENKEIPIERASISSILTDEMRIDYRKSILKKKSNAPFVRDVQIDVSKYKQNLKYGFINSYEKFLTDSNKIKLKIDTEKYNNIYSRQIMRATQYYSSMIQLSFHPDFLRSGLDREMLFSRLWIQVEEENKLERISGLEFLSMLKNDIPMFLSKINSCDVQDGNGKIVEKFFKNSSVDLVIKKINNINKKDLKIQSLLITTALNYDPKYNFAENKETKHEKILKITKKRRSYNDIKKEFIEISRNLANYLIENSFIGDNGDVSWIDMNIVGEKTNDWNMVPIGLDLYSGVSGILIYFVYLYKETNNKKYLNVVRQCYESIRIYFDRKDKYDRDKDKILFGGFSGETPLIYALIILEKELGDLFNLVEIESMRNSVLLSCEENLNKSKDHDVIIGSAGVIVILLKYYEFTKKREILDIIKVYAEEIIKGFVTMDNGVIAWQGSFAKRPLGGFAHGTSGIVWVLAKLYELTKDDRYLDIIERGLKYEDILYRANVNNWSDQRETDDGIKYDDIDNNIPVAWCHGASGILLNRLCLKKMDIPLSSKRKQKIEVDIFNAIETCLKYGLGRSHCLCHGDFGNIEILLFASEIMKDEKIKEKCDTYMEYILNDLKNGKWKCGIPYKDSPGMMVGLSGIGYGLLKLCNPSLPSILLLE